MKQCCPRVTTVFIRQGHYAHDKEILYRSPSADVSLKSIGDVLTYDMKTLIGSMK